MWSPARSSAPATTLSGMWDSWLLVVGSQLQRAEIFVDMRLATDAECFLMLVQR